MVNQDNGRKMRAIRNARDSRIERWVGQYGVTWEFMPDININSRVDLNASLHNQARFEQLDADVVKRYARFLLDDIELPPVVLYQPTEKAKFVTVDGNHRLAAHLEAAEVDARFQTVSGYVLLGASPQTISLMTVEANAGHGKPTSTEERISHAVWLVQSGGMAAKRAADRLGVDPNQVRKAINREKHILRATQAGITLKEWDRLGLFAQDRLAAVKTNEGLRAAARLVLAAGLRQQEINDLIREVNSTSGGAEQKKIVEALALGYADRIEAVAGGVLDKGRSKQGMTSKQRLLVSLGQFGALPEDLRAVVTMFRPPEVDSLRERVSEAITRLRALEAVLEDGDG